MKKVILVICLIAGTNLLFAQDKGVAFMCKKDSTSLTQDTVLSLECLDSRISPSDYFAFMADDVNKAFLFWGFSKEGNMFIKKINGKKVAIKSFDALTMRYVWRHYLTLDTTQHSVVHTTELKNGKVVPMDRAQHKGESMMKLDLADMQLPDLKGLGYSKDVVSLHCGNPTVGMVNIPKEEKPQDKKDTVVAKQNLDSTEVAPTVAVEGDTLTIAPKPKDPTPVPSPAPTPTPTPQSNKDCCGTYITTQNNYYGGTNEGSKASATGNNSYPGIVTSPPPGYTPTWFNAYIDVNGVHHDGEWRNVSNADLWREREKEIARLNTPAPRYEYYVGGSAVPSPCLYWDGGAWRNYSSGFHETVYVGVGGYYNSGVLYCGNGGYYNNGIWISYDLNGVWEWGPENHFWYKGPEHHEGSGDNGGKHHYGPRGH